MVATAALRQSCCAIDVCKEADRGANAWHIPTIWRRDKNREGMVATMAKDVLFYFSEQSTNTSSLVPFPSPSAARRGDRIWLVEYFFLYAYYPYSSSTGYVDLDTVILLL